MTIQELARRANVTPRTIRYYVEQGLLPSPDRGRPSDYGEEYLERLELIKGLKRQYLPLEEIRDTMQRLSASEIRDLISKHTPEQQRTAQPNSASEYIASVLGRSGGRLQVSEPAPPPDYRAAAAPPMFAPAPLAAPLPQPVRARDMMTSEGQQAQEQQEEVWHRVVLAPGIELHFSEVQGNQYREVVRRIIGAARQVLEQFPGKK